MLLAGASHGSQLDEVANAWRQYDEKLNSAEFRCTYRRTELKIKRSPNTALDPYAAPSSSDVSEPVTLTRELLVSMSGNKLACARNGETWDDVNSQVVNKSRVVAFDGKDTRYIYEDASRPMGVIVGASAQPSALTNSLEMNPLMTACTPSECLALQGFQIEASSSIDMAAEYEGIPAAKISIVAGHRALDIYVDQGNGYRIIALEEYYKSLRRGNLKLTYTDNDKVGWVLSGWRSDVYDGVGSPRVTLEGNVDNVVINEPIDDSVFTVNYPAGSHILKDNAHFQQGSDGKLKPITPAEFGRLSKEITDPNEHSLNFRMAGLSLTIGIVLVLMAAVYAKRR